MAASVDALLAGRQPPSELRWRGGDGKVLLQFESPEAAQLALAALGPQPGPVPMAPQGVPLEAEGLWLPQLVQRAALMAKLAV